MRICVKVSLQEVKAPKSNWRAKHEDFINTVRAARGVSVAMQRGDPLPPPPPPSINPGKRDRKLNAYFTYAAGTSTVFLSCNLYARLIWEAINIFLVVFLTQTMCNARTVPVVSMRKLLSAT